MGTLRPRAVPALLMAAALLPGTLAATTSPALAAPPGPTRVFTDPADDTAAGVDLLRVKVVNRATVRVVTRHTDLRRKGFGESFVVYLDTRRARPGPEFAVAGGLNSGTDWRTGRSTRRWKFRGDPLDEIGRCRADLELDWSRDIMRLKLGRDCLGGHQGQVRVAVKVTDGTSAGTDWGKDRRTFYGWVRRG